MNLVPTSKTRLAACVKAFDTDAVVAGLRLRPDLLHHADERGRNWLHLCASIDARKRGLDPADAVPLAGALVDLGIDVNAAAFTEGTWQATPLWYAISRGGNIDLARYLLTSGSTPEHCLWAAVYREDLAMIALLVDAGARLEAVAEEETPLLHAVKYSRFRGAQALLEAGADPDFRDLRGMTALHYMLKKNSDIRHFRTFAAYGARGDIPGHDGRTVPNSPTPTPWLIHCVRSVRRRRERATACRTWRLRYVVWWCPCRLSQEWPRSRLLHEIRRPIRRSA